MATTIAIINNKGGVLKTSIAVNLAGILTQNDKKVLLIDADSQASVSGSFGNFKITKNPSLYKLISPRLIISKYSLLEVMTGRISIEKAIMEEVMPNLDILPSRQSLDDFQDLVYKNKLKF